MKTFEITINYENETYFTWQIAETPMDLEEILDTLQYDIIDENTGEILDTIYVEEYMVCYEEVQ